MNAHTCPTCTPWAATTRAQLMNRFRLIARDDAEPFGCPDCGSRDWATTEHFITDASEYARAKGFTLRARLCFFAAAALVALAAFDQRLQLQAVSAIFAAILAMLGWLLLRERDEDRWQ